ncbi:MAG TPA: OmpH family outer membrane protein [Draconibacterium sp.]|nr:OmpH family outer membrane protein [Draconibacterium sp.]
MRNLTKFIAVVLFVGITASVSAQTPKFGHIDLQALIQVMPERAAAETEFNKFQGELEEIFGEMQKDLQTKMASFEQLGDSASEIKKSAKVAEIQDMQQRVQNYQQTAQQQLQTKQTELLKPVFDKAEVAISEVAKEKALIYVFDIGTKVVLYKSNESMDLLPLVKTKLGIK